MYDAIFRNGGHDPVNAASCFLPSEKLTFVEALRLYTTSAAYASATEDRQGSIKPGSYSGVNKILIERINWVYVNVYENLVLRFFIN